MRAFKSPFRRIVCVALLLATVPALDYAAKTTNQRNAVSPAASVSIGTVYSQNFDTLPSTGTTYTDDAASSPLPTGWGFYKVSLPTNVSYTVGTGSSNTGTVYSYGSTSSTDRALGEVGSGTTGSIQIGACFTNSTPNGVIQSLAITFNGEQWRGGGRTTGLDTLTFEYNPSATAISTTTGWTALSTLDFSSVQTPTAATVYDGNAAANRAAKSGTISGLTIPSGQSFCIRWTGPNITGNDDGLAIDDFTLTPSGTISLTPTLSVGNVTLNEGNSGTTAFNFTVQLSGPAQAGGVTFDVATADGTATVADNDYTAVNLTGETIAEGSNSKQFTVLVNGDAKVENNEAFTFRVTNVTGAIVSNGTATGTITNDDVSIVAIHDIQGAGARSPLEGVSLTTTGIVTSVTTDGYFLQTPDSDIDTDPNTSEGLFVFTSFAGTKPTVGQALNVSGTVQEFASTTNTSSSSYDPARLWMTELSTSSFVVNSSGNPLPAPIVLSTADFDPGFLVNDSTKVEPLEKYEGMRVTVSNIRVTQSTDFNNVFYAVLNTYAGRPMREPGIEANSQYPNVPNSLPADAPRFDSNPEVFAVDTDGRANVALTPAIVGVGQVIAGPITGVLDYGPHTFQILPDAAISVPTTTLPIRGVRAKASNEFTVASMNVEQFDASDARVTKIANSIVNTLQQPDIIGMQEVLSQANLDLLAQKVNTLIGSPTPSTGPYAGHIGTLTDSFSPAFYNAVLVNTNRVSGMSFSELASYSGRAPLIMTATVTVGSVSLPITLIDNHVKSLIGNDYLDDNSTRAKRQQNATNIADLVQPRVLAGENVILTGDYNSYQFNDSYVDVIGIIRGVPASCTQVLVCVPDSWSHTLLLPEEIFLPTQERYSYLFRGDAQAIDHIMASPNLLNVMEDYAVGHINSEYPPSFKNDNNNPARYSDHDHPVLYLRLQAPTEITVASTSVVFNRVTQTFNATLQLTNKSSSPVTDRIFVVLKDLPAGVVVTNQAGTYNGAPYLFTDNDLAANGTTTMLMQYKAPSGVQVTYTPQVYTGVLP